MHRPSQKTTSLTVSQAAESKKWVVIDAQGLVVGRLAAIVAKRLRGKHRADYTPHVDCGDNVVIVNAAKVELTGKKRAAKKYYHHSGHIGGIKERTARFILDGRHPERVVEKAVERMLPRGPLFRRIMGNLRVYPGPDHPHAAQQPAPLDVGSENPKNKPDRVERSNASHPDLDRMLLALLKAGSRIWADDKESARFGAMVATMDTSALAGAINKLLMELDSDDVAVVSRALTKLSFILPRLDLAERMRDPEMRKILRGVPDRLLAALTANLERSGAAKKAAFALVAAMYPEHYRGKLAADEEQARTDLEDIFEKNHVHSFTSVRTMEASDHATGIEARVWNEVPFDLAGKKPALAEAHLPQKGARFDVAVAGATAVDVQPVPRERLRDGQNVGVKARLVPDRKTALHDKVVVDFQQDGSIYAREVYDFGALFPSARG